MGLLSSKLQEVFAKLKNASHARILMLGLDAAGKTTILYKVKLDEIVKTVPTIGFNVETVTPCKGITFTVWDIGGQEKLRSLWRYYYKDVDGLIFVVDSADRMRIDEARHELYQLCKTDELKGVPVIVIANKQDQPGALSVSQITEELQLYRDLRGRKWSVQKACATKGEGIFEAMDELVRLVKERRKQNSKEIIPRGSF